MPYTEYWSPLSSYADGSTAVSFRRCLYRSAYRYLLVKVRQDVACWSTPPWYAFSSVILVSGMIKLALVLNHEYCALNGYGGLSVTNELK